MTLTGTASSPEPLPPIDIYAELEWVSFLSNGDDAMNGGGSKLASEGEFPARFTLEVFHEPWDAWLNDFSRYGASPRESRIGLALLRADGELAFRSSGWNAFARHVLVYVDSDIQPGTTSETFAGGLLTAGFHVLEVVDAPCDSYLPADDPSEGGLDCLRPAPQDLDSQLDLRFFREAESQPEHPPEVPHLFD
ncbi:MAG TPA: hypothetical protein VNO33_13845 [Kofleriaceae bacterium]|nr:hypothetical protein [Kofleriaceae bacterium]